MNDCGPRRLVLDAHGVVLDNPLPDFLREVARETGQAPEEFKRRWRDEIRRDAWLGLDPDDRLWDRITRGIGDAAEWRSRLEERYMPGPAAGHLERWRRSVPLWMLSNHRRSWLLPRLARLGFAGMFERILISDEIGAVKPEAAAFRAALQGLARSDHALVVDDRKRNVVAARELGIPAVRVVSGDESWVREVDAWLGQSDPGTDTLVGYRPWRRGHEERSDGTGPLRPVRPRGTDRDEEKRVP